MPVTALNHFDQDVARARAIVSHADPLPNVNPVAQMLRSDLLRSAWMFAVGAMDAYFCDAYTDIVAATIISKSRHPAVNLPEFFYDIKFPVRAILEPYANNENWRWRMAARKMMERENVLSLTTVQTLFNKFFRRGHRLFRDRIADWIVHPDAGKRLFGITRTSFNALAANQMGQAVEDAQEQMEDRYRDLFQRRHDCIHNWRPSEGFAAIAATRWDRLQGNSTLRVPRTPVRRTHQHGVSRVSIGDRLPRSDRCAGRVLKE